MTPVLMDKIILRGLAGTTFVIQAPMMAPVKARVRTSVSMALRNKMFVMGRGK
jgi:hypothetical protein